MMFSKETLAIFAELLNQVQVRPMQEGADQTWARLIVARNELAVAIREVNPEA